MAEMVFKGTPGPWSIDPTNGDIVSGHLNVGIPYATRKEDKVLMTAAPDLLAAARKALNFIENTEGEMGETLDSGDALRAAIAKALQS